MGVAGANEHRAVHDRKDVDFVGDMFVDDTVRAAHRLSEAVEIWWKRPKAFLGNLVAKFGKWREQSYCLSEVSVPSTGHFTRFLAANEPDNGHSLAVGVLRPLGSHRLSIPSSIFSISSKDSSSVRHSPFSNCLREMAMALASSAFPRSVSISFHVFSKSATLIITLVLRPFCVMTIGRCVRAVRAKQSLRVRRYSVKGTTSSSRRGRSIVLDFVRISVSPFQTDNMVHYSVPYVNGVLSIVAGACVEWQTVTDENKAEMRFVKVEVVLP